jgi:hypothetical protein
VPPPAPPPPPPPPPPKAEVPTPELKPAPPKETAKAPEEPAKPKPSKKETEAEFEKMMLKSLEKMKPPPKTDDFADLKKTLQAMQTPPPAPQPQPTVAATPPADLSTRATASDIAGIRAQIEPRWNLDIGARDAASLIVRIHVTLLPDGTVSRADIVDDPRYNTDSFYRSAAESARRAVWAASPLRLPPDGYERLKEITLVFDPREIGR